MGNFLARLKAKKQGTKAPASTNGSNGSEVKAKAANVPKIDKPEGVLADDAPSRETPVKTEEEIAAEVALEKAQKNAEKARKKAAAAAKKATKKTTAKKKTPTREGLHLFIDCMQIKDLNNNTGLDPTLFEDWIGPIVENLNAETLEHKKLPDYRLLPYAEEKAAFATAITARIDNLPQYMIVNTGTPGAKDALGVLIPHAVEIVKGFR